MADETEVKKYSTNSLGFPLVFNGPATVEAYDRAAGKVGLCLEDACENTIYRGTLPEWQEAFAKKVAELTGQTRQVDADKTAKARERSKTPDKVKDVYETVKTFVNRQMAAMSPSDKEALGKLAQEVADSITVDPSPSKRVSGPGKDVKAKADQLLTLPEDQLQAKIDKYLEKVPGFEVEMEDGKPVRDSLARLLGQYLDAILAED